MEEKVNIKLYHGEIETLKLNHRLQQLEFYFSVHQIKEGKNISFVWIIRGPCNDLVGETHGNRDVGGRTSSD